MLLRTAVPADPLEPGRWLKTGREDVTLALNLMPFAGLAFLWFVGVLRDRLAEKEDRFFATVFLGSAVLLLAVLFVSAAIIGALLLVSTAGADDFAGTTTFHIARATIFILVNVYALKLAGMFMISTSTVVIYTRIAPRGIAIVGYLFALVLLFGSSLVSWAFILLPAWVLLLSLHIVIETFRRPA
ncbi:hypothetical protein MWN34_17610 [Ancylobacter sp. 6x-1]|uniref:DUF2189 domain-containing protein n=1 Tax=Ancylobacter crimeensis TaxID=2579147 RepID=A0ABT0DFI3_9HYPH|nr:hypothetical protein [Ancylobacter crimeensis]